MAVVTTELKKVFNRAHDRLHDSILPLGIQPATEPPSPMPSQNPPIQIDTTIFKTDTSLTERAKQLRVESQSFFEHLKFIFFIPLSWFLTITHFVTVLIWRIWTLPLRLSINFYERRIRHEFDWLPSIWGTLFVLFPEGIKFPTFTSLTAGPYKGPGPIGQHETMDVDLDAIINGTAGQNGADHDDSVGNGGSYPSQVNTNRSKLETALKNILTFSPGDLDAGLEQVKAAQAEAEKSLKLTGSE